MIDAKAALAARFAEGVVVEGRPTPVPRGRTRFSWSGGVEEGELHVLLLAIDPAGEQQEQEGERRRQSIGEQCNQGPVALQRASADSREFRRNSRGRHPTKRRREW